LKTPIPLRQKEKLFHQLLINRFFLMSFGFSFNPFFISLLQIHKVESKSSSDVYLVNNADRGAGVGSLCVRCL
jgi:hypothetical protein